MLERRDFIKTIAGVPALVRALSLSGASSPGADSRYFSLFCYPWDVLAEGVDKFATVASDLKLNHITMAASYHGGKVLLPHNPRHHVYFVEDGAIYLPASPQFFGSTTMKPRVSQLTAGRDSWKEITDACLKRGVQTTAWVVWFHNTHLATTYPQLATQNALGDRYRHALCPAQPAVMEYMRALAKDLASYPLDAVEFEAFEFTSFRHFSFLEKEGIEVTPFAELMLSLCFCPACLAKAKKHNVDGAAMEKGARLWLEDYFEGKNRERQPIDGLISSVPGLGEYLEVRFATIRDGLAEVSDILREKKKRVIYLGYEQKRSYVEGVDMQQIEKLVDVVELTFYGKKAEAAPQAVQNIRRATGANTAIYFALIPGYPDAKEEADLVGLTKASLNAGVTGVSYYNFGLFEKSHLNWIRRAIPTAG